MIPNATRQPRRSLHVSDAESGGGAEVVFRATLQAAEELGDTTDDYVGTGVRNPISYVFSVKHYRGMLRKLREFSPDVVHLHNFYHYLSPSILLALRRYRKSASTCRVIFTAHDYHLICPNSGLQHVVNGRLQSYDALAPRFSVWHRFDERSVIHSFLKIAQHMVAYRLLRLRDVIDTVISPSDFLRDVFAAGGVSADIKVVRNPVDFVDLPNDCGAGEGLVYIGRVAPEKGLVEFVLALESAHAGVSLAIYGDGPDAARLHELQLSLQHVKLTFHGVVAHEEIAVVLRKYRALVHASLWHENAPVSIIEAASQGLDLVVCAGGGGEEMARFARRQFIFETGDARSLSAAVLSALAQEGKNDIIDPSEFALRSYREKLSLVYSARS